MVRSKVRWTHKKYKNKRFIGTYGYARGNRVFILVQDGGDSSKGVAYESWQAAKASGWTKGPK